MDSDSDEESSDDGEAMEEEELFQIATNNEITAAACASLLAGGIANIGQNRLTDSRLQDSSLEHESDTIFSIHYGKTLQRHCKKACLRIEG